jgi:glycosyltransferase involved in cell wall biosynthesis
MLEDITPLLITFDEMPNLERTFASLKWAARIIVVDSGSTDGTRDWLEKDDRVTLLVRAFDDHTNQWEFGRREGGIDTKWLLALDADHVLSSDLVEEISSLNPESEVGGYEAGFVYCILGKALRASLYPPRIVLARTDAARFERDGHTQKLVVGGETRRLRARIRHDDRKPRSRWLAEQARYSKSESVKLLGRAAGPLSLSDRVRRVGWIAPWLAPLWCLIVKGTILDGRAGWIYAGERAVAEWMLAMELWAQRLKKNRGTQ